MTSHKPVQRVLALLLIVLVMDGASRGACEDKESRTKAEEKARGAVADKQQGPESSPLDDKLRQAFGERCPEVERAIKLELRKRGLLLTADEATFEADGRLRLSPCSIARFGNQKGTTDTPVVTTLRSQHAYLTLDRPLGSFDDLGSCELLTIELTGGMRLIVEAQQ
ncbi:MAG TPA: hypothetical protein VEL76_30815 [Gemmataceae bacterium]|nr:hypothetical protein [Gemmataceae bacterium]